MQISPVVSDEILVRRRKNRERQRRYRERKRRESDLRRTCLLNQHQTSQSDALLNLTPVNTSSSNAVCSFPYEARIYSGRNWKKDARETHIRSNGRRNWKAEARNKNNQVVNFVFLLSYPRLITTPNPKNSYIEPLEIVSGMSVRRLHLWYIYFLFVSANKEGS
ncbi:hypothetical protein Cni_G28332 [Canna indica]|uniref:BZIP domain-containing protein n=1 Tax=Canna indica TaxID=4628 RepID=A0AAQ3L2T3_9LILI|nr:hypothetical protein Cni_G28332 [Canna indica]